MNLVNIKLYANLGCELKDRRQILFLILKEFKRIS